MDLIQSDPEIPSLTQTTQPLASLTRSQTATLTSDSESDSCSQKMTSIHLAVAAVTVMMVSAGLRVGTHMFACE